MAENDVILQYFPPVNNRVDLIARNVSNPDLAKIIEAQFPRAVEQCKNFVPIIKGDSVEATHSKIWHFLKGYTTYDRDSNQWQLIRMPNFFMKYRKGDCKTYALCSAAMLQACYPHFKVGFRYSAYRPGASIPTHIYTIFNDGTGERIIDCCWMYFNSEKKPTFAETHYMNAAVLSDNLSRKRAKMRQMPPYVQNRIQLLNKARAAKVLMNTDGREDEGRQMMEEVRDQWMDDAADAITEDLCGISADQREELKQRHKEHMQAVGHVAAKIALSAARGATNALIRLNFHGLATKILRLNAKKLLGPTLEKWIKFGGEEKSLLKAAEHGAQHKPFFLGNKKAKARFEKQISGTKEMLLHAAVPELEALKMLPALIQLRGRMDSGILQAGKAAGLFGIEDEGLGIAPAVAAIVASALPVMGSLVASMAKSFHQSGEANANDLPELAGAAMNLIAAGEGTTNENAAVNENYLSDCLEAICEATTPTTPAAGADKGKYNSELWTELGGKLGDLAGKVLGKLRDKWASKSKTAATLLKNGETGAQDYLTGAYLRQSGTLDELKKADALGGSLGKLLPWGLGIGLLYALAR